MKTNKTPFAMGIILIMAVLAGPVAAQYPPLSEYLMPRDAEIARAKSAAPANISGRATIKVLTASGYQIVREGDNGFVCMVMRGWAAPTYTPHSSVTSSTTQKSARPSVSTGEHRER
jgi:hypothetical protein